MGSLGVTVWPKLFYSLWPSLDHQLSEYVWFAWSISNSLGENWGHTYRHTVHTYNTRQIYIERGKDLIVSFNCMHTFELWGLLSRTPLPSGRARRPHNKGNPGSLKIHPAGMEPVWPTRMGRLFPRGTPLPSDGKIPKWAGQIWTSLLWGLP